MKLTKDNFEKELGDLQKSVDNLPKLEVDLVDSSVNRLKDKIKEIRENAQNLLANNRVLRLGVVGQVKAGKSSFLNSLIFDGEDVLPRAATPMTAGLTIIEHGNENEFEIEFYNTTEWSFFEDRAKEYDSIIAANRAAYPDATENDIASLAGIPDELKAAKELVAATSGKAKSCIKSTAEKKIEKFSGLKDLHGKLAQYVGADGSYTSVVKALTIRMDDKRLNDLQVVDTPGVNDPIISREERTRQFLSGCHGVFFLSYSGSFFDATDVSFLVNRIGGQGIGDVVVIASKFDSALQDVGHQFHDDLAGAAEHLEKALRKQMDRNIGSSDYRGKAPSFDFSSGIGYSIAKKGESRWDATEKNVVDQMKRFYPSFFSTADDIKETFLNLAQITDIQEKYLKDFARNKDRIINSKMNSYFANISNELAQYATEVANRGKNTLQTLQESTASSLEKKKKSTDSLLRKLSGDINRLIAGAQSDIHRLTIKIGNDYRLTPMAIQTENKSYSCSRKSTFWGNTKRFSMVLEVIEPHKTKNPVKDKWESILKKVVEEWDKGLSNISSNLMTEINSIIQDAEEKDSDMVLDADAIRDIIKDAMQGLNSYKTPDISKLLASIDALDFQAATSIDTFAGTVEESEAKERIRKWANEKLSEASRTLTNLKDNANNEVKNLLNKQASDAKAVLTEKQKNMITEVREKINNYLNELEAKIQNKRQEEQKIKNFCDSVNRIQNIIQA